MLYFLLYQILFKLYGAEPDSPYFYKVLNVIQYVTFRTAIAAITALLISLLLGRKVIRKLSDLKFGQEIREEGPARHIVKQGTPTMGGLLILATVGNDPQYPDVTPRDAQALREWETMRKAAE